MYIWTTEEESLESVDRFSYDKCAEGLYSCVEGTVNSLHLKKPKKAIQQAAHKRIFSKLCGS